MPDPGDDEEALRARLSKLSGDLKERAASHAPPPSGSAPPGADGMGSAMSMGLRAGSEFVAAIILGAGDRLGDRPRARDQSSVSHRIFHARRRGRRLERNPGDFAKRRLFWPQFALVSRGPAR